MIGSTTTPSGIPGIGKVPWGTHLCHFFRNREELVESIIPYFIAGLKNNEQCMWGAAAPLYADEARREIVKKYPAFERHVREGRITIFDHHEWYTENQSVDPVQDLLQAEEKALKAGRKGLRCGGNISWLTQQDWTPFYLYETRVTRAVHGRRILAICSYNLDQCEGTHVYDSIRSHHYTLSRRERAWEMVVSAKA
jgi:hypothetical protein